METSSLFPSSTEDSALKNGLFRLAHFNPSYTDEYGNQVIDYLLLDSLANYDPKTEVSPEAIKLIIKDVFKLDFEETEIDKSTQRLSKRGLINYQESTDRFGQPSMSILTEHKEKIQSNLLYTRQLESKVIEEWKQELSDKYNNKPELIEHLDQIVEYLQRSISKMFLRHGIASVYILYPDSEKAKEWGNDIDENIFKDFEEIDPFVDTIIKIEFTTFFKTNNKNRKRYITSLFNSSFYWHLIHVDHKCSRLLSELTKGLQLYLDNNILFSMMGLDGPYIMKAVHSLLNFAKELGYETLVTTKTLDEFHASLNWKFKELNQKTLIPRELASIAIRNLEPDNFIVVYWKEYVETGQSIKEFITEKSHVETILNGMNIKITDIYRKEIECSTLLVDEESILRQACGSHLHNNIVQHDAFHRLLINKLRNGRKYNFLKASAWFLTHDGKLSIYDRFARKGEGYLPFCITTDEWIQINRPLLARTKNHEEYEESLHMLITQPFLRTMIPSISLDVAYQNVLGKLSKFKNMNPNLAIEIITDNHFVASMAEDDTDDQLDEKLENKIIDLADEYKIKNIEFEESIKDSNKQLLALRRDYNKMQEVVTLQAKQQKELDYLMKDFLESLDLNNDEDKPTTAKIKDLKSHLNKQDEAIKVLESEKNVIKEAFILFKKSFIRWSLFFVAFLISSLMIWFHHFLIEWTFFNSLPKLIYIKIVATILFLSFFIHIPLHKHWKTLIAPTVSLFIALVILMSIP